MNTQTHDELHQFLYDAFECKGCGTLRAGNEKSTPCPYCKELEEDEAKLREEAEEDWDNTERDLAEEYDEIERVWREEK